MDSIDRKALEYHSAFPSGKIAVKPTKPTDTQEDLSLAYTPGVAAPVMAIADNPDAVYDYTAKGNLVAVISNGTAILGLGNKGAAAAKPVMEGKALLFKILGGVDAFDIEVDATDIDRFRRCLESVSAEDRDAAARYVEETYAADILTLEDLEGVLNVVETSARYKATGEL